MRELIAILRGVEPQEVESIADVIYDAGIHKIEVPLNSPEPYDSIERLATRFGSRALIGAGTVLRVEEVQQVADAGGQIIVSPNCNVGVIAATKNAGMLSYPGVFTASECFQALEAGADGLKLFPASVLGIDGLKALRAVLPAHVAYYGVSGINAAEFHAWKGAGMTGFGIGSNLYKAGMDSVAVKHNAIQLVEAYDACVETSAR